MSSLLARSCKWIQKYTETIHKQWLSNYILENHKIRRSSENGKRERVSFKSFYYNIVAIFQISDEIEECLNAAIRNFLLHSFLTCGSFDPQIRVTKWKHAASIQTYLKRPIFCLRAKAGKNSFLGYAVFRISLVRALNLFDFENWRRLANFKTILSDDRAHATMTMR